MLKLSPRERAVARCLISGYSYEDIAKELGIGQRTIKQHHVRAILIQTDTKSVDAAKLWIVRNPEALSHVMEC